MRNTECLNLVQEMLVNVRKLNEKFSVGDARLEYFDYALSEGFKKMPKEFQMKLWTPKDLETWLLNQTDWIQYDQEIGPYFICNEYQIPGTVIITELPEDAVITLVELNPDSYIGTTPMTEELRVKERRSVMVYYDPNRKFNEGELLVTRIVPDFDKSKLSCCPQNLSWYLKPDSIKRWQSDQALPKSWNMDISNKDGVNITKAEAKRMLFNRIKLI